MLAIFIILLIFIMKENHKALAPDSVDICGKVVAAAVIWSHVEFGLLRIEICLFFQMK